MIPLLVTLAFAPAPLSPDTLRGFDHFYNLEYAEALVIFRRIAASDKDDARAENYVAQTVLYNAMLKAGALESELVTGSNAFLRRERMNPTQDEHAMFDQAIASAFARSQQRLATNPKDADALDSIAITYGLRANYNFLVRKAWVDSLRDFTAARKHAQMAFDADPSHIDTKIILGLHDYVVGSLSWTYRFLGFLAGIRGDREGGIRMVEEVAAKGNINRTDARVLLTAIYRREKRSALAVGLLEGLIHDYPRNYLFRLELAQMYGDLGEREKSIATVDAVADLQRRQAPGFASLPVEKISFIKGNLLFWFDEYERAVPELQKSAAARDSLDLNTGISACLRLGQTLDLMNRRKEAIAAYQMGAALAPDSELARECQRYISRQYKRNRIA